MADEPRFPDVAEAVADGRSIDWTAEGRRAESDVEREELAALRELAELGRFFDENAEPESPTELQPGAAWGHLRILEHGGRGRFGDVYKAWDPALDRTVALKLIRNEAGTTVASDLVEEGRLMALVRHPNVVTIHGAQRIDNVTGLWMEWVDGRTLEAELTERGRFDAGDLQQIALELADALDAVHAAGLVHRDVKPTNVLRDSAGRVRLGDFGAGHDAVGSAAQPGNLAGTPAYLAPEVLQQRPPTPASDLYSVGVLLFHLATAEYPMAGRSLTELRTQHSATRPDSLAERRSDLPVQFTRAVDRLLDPDPARRFDSAREFARVIAPPKAGQRPAIVLAFAAGALAVLGAIAVIAWRSSTTTGSGSLTLTEVAPDPALNVTFRGPSVDGRLIPCASSNQSLMICDLVNGPSRLLKSAADGKFLFAARSTLVSPDGRQIAFVWGGRGSSSVRMIDVDGRNDREVYGSAELMNWLGNSRAIIALERPQPGGRAKVLRLPADGSRPTVIAEIPPEYSFVDLSPDMRMFVATQSSQGADRDLFSIDAVTGRTQALLEGPSDDYFPLWTPDGRRILFASNRIPGSSLMSVAVVDGRAAGEPVVVRSFGPDRIRPFGFAADGSVFVNVTPLARRVMTVDVDAAYRPAGPVHPIDSTEVGNTMGADWSRDGAYIAHLVSDVPSYTGRLILRRTDGASLRRVPLDGLVPNGAAVRWSHDGRTLAVSTDQSTTTARLQILSVDSATFTTVALGEWNRGLGIRSPAFDPRDHSLVFLQGSRVMRYDPATKTTSPASPATTPVTVLAVNRHDGAMAVGVAEPGASSPRCRVRLVERDGTERDRHLFAHPCLSMAWTHDGARLLVGSWDDRDRPSLFLLDRAAGQPERLPIEAPLFHDLSPSPDGRRLLFTTGNPRPQFWRVSGMSD